MPTKKLTKRWLYNNFLVILIFLSALIIAFSLAIRNYYYNSVLSVVKNTAAVQNASLINYSEDNTVDFSVAARKMVEDFEDKDLMELMAIDKSGTVIMSCAIPCLHLLSMIPIFLPCDMLYPSPQSNGRFIS